MSPQQPIVEEPAARISKLLGLYKAEWLNGNLFELFTEPGYFGELKTKRPCVLIGGRGTGKTTVLRGLSYQGQFLLGNRDRASVPEWQFYGLYHRVNTNRVTAFRGPELTEERWIAHFAHYVNLTFCSLMLEFAAWHELQTGIALEVDEASLENFQATLGLRDLKTLRALSKEVEYLLLNFEGSINSIADSAPTRLSMQGAPIDALAKALICTPQLAGKQFFFLIDEFENYEDYQQRVLNTIIKHATTDYTFKIGVKELGWRQRATLNANEQLTSPADYARITIADVLDASRFKAFAERVITARLGTGFDTEGPAPQPQEMFPSLTELEEAQRLLEGTDLEEFMVPLRKALSSDEYDMASKFPIGQLYFLKYWTDSHGDESYPAAVVQSLHGDSTWSTRFENHFYASLFSIRKGKRGIRKFYCGWEVLLALSHGNIRYLLELVHSAFLRHIEGGGALREPVSVEAQTQAAQAVGRKNLSELEGLSVEGARLTKLLLGLGRVFQVLAEDPAGHAPEVNQFHMREDSSSDVLDEKANEILQHAVMHLALVRFPGSKLMDERDTRAYDYMIHPVFAPFFAFSHRKKRKLQLSSSQVMQLIERPRSGIRDVLSQNNRVDNNVPLPDQLQLFGAFYEGS